MTQQKAASPEEKLEEAAKAVGLHKIHEEEFFKTPGNSTEFDKLCNEIDDKGIPKSKAKELCIDLVHRLEKLSNDNPPKHNEYCSYLRYWLYEKIGEIHADKSGNIDNVFFFKNLIEAWKKVNSEKLKNKCPPEQLTRVKLSELKNRILSYIYFKNLEKIKTISTSKNQDNCTKYLTYLESFKTVHDGYKNNHCRSFFFMSSNGTDYFPCKDKGVLESRITELQKCKIGDKPDPKTVLPSQAVGKGDLGAAPAKDQKVSGGTTELKAPVAVASSSSSSTAVTTSPASTTNISFRSFTNFYKYIEYKNFNKAGEYNKYIRWKRFAGYGNHRYTKCSRFNKFNRSRISTSIGYRRSPGYGLQAVSSYNSNNGGDTNLATVADVPGSSETLYDKLDSNTVKNIVMAAAVLGIIFFLFYYNRVITYYI
ncbi:hypothetical protein PVBG_05613 [Plasmodium vivax Brazil I]|uniref:Uncharacterized protein n=1 Tax=Plasmodium vivax (strain Brazil I) TaxID=1033975 RepID=A0A0J9T2L1_PLAV1|nr:hypothetical protein PVBG_05613 [Plasmodium vivax Brazil I]